MRPSWLRSRSSPSAWTTRQRRYVDVCWDVSDVDIVDGDGKSVVTPERKDVGWTRFTVTNATWDTAPTDGWRVSGGSDLEKEPCVGS